VLRTGTDRERDGPLTEDTKTQTDDQDVQEDAVGLLDSLSQEDTEEVQGAEKSDQGSSDSVDVDKIVEQIETRLGERFDAVADRRVNAILKELRKREKAEQAPKTEQAEKVDARAARMTFKEYLTDEVQFIGVEERKFAMDLGSALIGSRVSVSDDEETLGREVADEVATQMKAMRQYYEARTVDALRRRGALKPAEGQPSKTPATVGGQSEWAKGAALAESMYKKS